jgi:hypothetical protein
VLAGVAVQCRQQHGAKYDGERDLYCALHGVAPAPPTQQITCPASARAKGEGELLWRPSMWRGILTRLDPMASPANWSISRVRRQ